MLVNENNSQPYMKSLATCLNKVVHDGYTENFKVTASGLESLEHNKVYPPEQVEVINFFRFEGTSNPEDEAVLYVIETSDGIKGTLTDAYGVYTDPVVANFIRNVDNFHKKNTRN